MTATTDTISTPQAPLLWDRMTTAVQLGGVSRRHLDNLVRAGHLHPIRVGRRVMFRPADVRAYVDALAATATR